MLATQTLITKRSKNMRIKVEGQLAPGVSSKDIILHVIGQIGTAGGTGAVIEYCGSAIENLSVEARMSIVSATHPYVILEMRGDPGSYGLIYLVHLLRLT